jgi:hypothetical protein
MTASWIGARHPTDIVNGVSNLVATSPNLPAIPIDGAARGSLELVAQQAIPPSGGADAGEVVFYASLTLGVNFL